MSWPALFSLTNLIAVLGWAALLFLPRRPVILSAILYLGVGLLCLTYLVLFVASLSGLADPDRVAGTPPPDLSNYSIGGIRSLFMSDGGIVVGWTHYLAFDLFVGLWIARDGDAKGVSRWAQAPILLATFLAGPIGLVLWLVIRGRKSKPR